MTTRRPSFAERRARADARRAERADIEDPAVVLEAAAAFLAVRPRSVDETRRRLRHLGYAEAPIAIVLDRLLEFGYLDDEAFARSWVESRDRARPRGETALRRELRLKGVEAVVIDVVIAERDAGRPLSPAETGVGGGATPARVDIESGGGDRADDPDDVAARRLVARRASSLAREPDLRKRRQKAYALLARNGFAPDVCARVAAEWTAESVTDAGDDEPSEAAGDAV